MDIAGGYSLRIAGGSENTFDGCYIGLDTIARGTAANADIYLASAATRNVFRNCFISGYAEHATNYNFVNAAASGAIDRFVLFQDCIFHNPSTLSAGTAMTGGAIASHASVGGTIILKDCVVIGCSEIATADTSTVIVSMTAPTADGGGLGLAATR
jgi:hypothetical protein